MKYINKIDTEVFLFLNGLHNPIMDVILFFVCHNLFFIPFFVILIDEVNKEFRNKSLYVLFIIVILIVSCDQTIYHLINPFIKRLRPSHEPTIQHLVNLTNAGPGSLYGFISRHVSNALSLFTFIFLLFDKNKNWLKFILFLWTLLVSFGTIYMGFHYPLNIICSSFIGITFGYLFYFIFKSIIQNT